jgi:predicted RNA-binding Zn ribbon-like protein
MLVLSIAVSLTAVSGLLVSAYPNLRSRYSGFTAEEDTMVATSTTPPEVELVKGFLNTLDLDEGTDALSSPAALAQWLEEAGLVEAGTPASGRDLRTALALRDALRAELVHHHDGTDDPAARAALEEVFADLPLRAVSSEAGLAPCAGGARGALAALAAAAATARLKGSWPRLKVCPADDCQWAFYDTSRNRSRRWCSMEVCGNRSKVRAFRDRSR